MSGDPTAVLYARIRDLQNVQDLQILQGLQMPPYSPHAAGAGGNSSEQKTREKRKTSKLVEYEATSKVLPYERRPCKRGRNHSDNVVNPIKGQWRPEEDAALSMMASTDPRMKWSEIARSPELQGKDFCTNGA
jgi:hypothetical protein